MTPCVYFVYNIPKIPPYVTPPIGPQQSNPELPHPRPGPSLPIPHNLLQRPAARRHQRLILIKVQRPDCEHGLPNPPPPTIIDPQPKQTPHPNLILTGKTQNRSTGQWHPQPNRIFYGGWPVHWVWEDVEEAAE